MIQQEALRGKVMQSHGRCKACGLSTGQEYSRRILSESEQQKVFSKNRNLIMTASYYMDKLIEFVKGTDFFVLLTDGQGCILNASGDEKILAEAFAMKMVPGAYMDEQSIGTNAMSMVLTDREPVQVSGREHFIKAYHKWTCSAAPIMNSKNQILGVLNLTGYIENVHPHTLGMVVAAANAIEEMIKFKECTMLQNINSKHVSGVFQSVPVAVVTSDMDGAIQLYNRKAVEMLGGSVNELRAKNMSEITSDWDKMKNGLSSGETTIRHVNINSLRDKYVCTFKVNPIYNRDSNEVEIVYAIEETEQKKSNKNNGQAYYTFDKIIGEDENYVKTIKYAKKIASSKSTILIMGESGTGKEVFAQSIHNYSDRVDGPFIALNCGAIPKQLIESELFGYEEGAFTGAKKGGNIGKFELADGGTIMLDEIGEMPLDMQTKLLRVVQEGVITRIGGSKAVGVDVRIIAATNKDLKREVELGRFRKDLYYRLNVLPIYLPPLRERKRDIPLLMDFFMGNISSRLGKKPVKIPDEYLRKIVDYHWPGNIRELENVVELIINTESVPSFYFGEGQGYEEGSIMEIGEEDMSLENMEKKHIESTLRKCSWNITNTAQALGIMRNTLYGKIKKYNIKVKK